MRFPRSVGDLAGKKDALFSRIFSVSSCEGNLIIPSGMTVFISKHFGQSSSVRKQTITKIGNSITGDEALFNSLRAKRPLESPESESEDYLIKDNCSFCRPEKMTPSDTFGRIRGKHCTTASNVAKFDAWHGLIIFKEHDPWAFLDIGPEFLADCFSVSNGWFSKVAKEDSRSKERFIIWNCLWRAAASINHGHMQILSSRSPYAEQLRLEESIKKYSKRFGSDYPEDFMTVHEKLGLSKKYNNASLIFHLCPKKEKEIIIISDSLTSLSEPMFDALKFYHSLGVRSFNSAISFVGKKVFARMVDRGPLAGRTSDIGSMELYASPAVSSDPFSLAKAFREKH